jgi:hypothetical protein
VTFTLTAPGGGTTVLTSVTDATGAASVSFTPIVKGVHTVSATFAATGGLTAASSNTASISVYQRTSLALGSVTGTAGTTLAVSATLTALPSGVPIAGETVTFSFSGAIASQTATIDATGVATVTVSFPNAGTFATTATFIDAANFYADAVGNLVPTTTTSNAVILTTTTALSTLTPPAAVTVGATIPVSTVLRRVSTPSGPVTAATVVFTFTAPDGSTTTASTTTNASGLATAVATATMKGLYTVAASYAGSAALAATTSSTATITVYQRTSLALGSVTGTAGTSLAVNATLTTLPGGAPIVGETVTFSFAGVVPAQTATTDTNGVATVNVTFPSVGTFNMTATFGDAANFFTDGSGSTSPVIATVAAGTATIASAATTLSNLVAPTAANVGGALTVSTTLARTSAPAGALTGQSVTFTLTAPGGGTTVLTSVTDVTGAASVSFTPSVKGVHTVSATFAGTGGLTTASSNADSISVYQRTSLALGSVTGTAGTSLAVSATLTTLPGGASIGGEAVTFNFGGVVPAQTATTDTNGVATVTVNFPNAGTFATTATFIDAANFYADNSGAFPVVATTTSSTAMITSPVTPCPIGTYSATGSTPCTPAAAGSFVSTIGAVSATPCAPGTYSAVTGASACTPAPPGEFVSTTGATFAALCAPGSYSSSPGATSCTLAPPGSFVSGSGATVATPCPVGTTSTVAGATACIPVTTPTAGRMHGDGWLAGPAGDLDARERFAFDVTELATGQNGARFGFWFVDPDDRPRQSNNFEATSFTSITFSDNPAFTPGGHPAPTVDAVTFSGAGSLDGVSGYTFVVTATDQGEPGVGLDTFSLVVRDGTNAVVINVSGAIAGGNVQSYRLPGRRKAPMILTAPPDQGAVEATGPGGAVVTYPAPSAVDANGASVPVVCVPPSGSTFALGRAHGTCTAIDSLGNTSTLSFYVVVVDTVAPVLAHVPADVTVEATSRNGAVVTYALPTATDAVDTSVMVKCAPASGRPFDLGTTTVTCKATDKSGNQATASFTVTVVDTTPPVFSTPPVNITMDATSPAGAKVTFTKPSATDASDHDVTVVCAPASGSTFPIATTAVTCTATDDSGHTATTTFNVTVRDMTAPTIANHANLTAQATSPAGAVVTFTSPATHDAVDGAGVATCLPASGSTFPIGISTVTCAATDAAGNTSTSSFTVTVRDTVDPTITITNPSGAYEQNAAVTVNFVCADTGSGVASCTGTLANGSPLNTHTAGTFSFTVTAIDNAGNSATRTVTYKVK